MIMPKELGVLKGLSVRSCILLASAVQAVAATTFLAMFYRHLSGKGTNVDLYFTYASRIIGGAIPYRQFDVEYPLFALPILLIPRFFATTLTWYQVGLAAEMILFNTLTVALVARRVEHDEGKDRVLGRLAWYTSFSILMCPLLLVRYDLAPTFLGFAAAAWWSSGRALGGGIAAGAGVLMKVFPGACALPALLREVLHPRTSRLRGTLAFTATVLLSLAFWVLLAGRGFLTFLKYHTERGLEIGSIYAGAVMMLGWFTGDLPAVDFNFGGFNLGGPWAARLSPLAFPIQMASLLVVLWMYRRSGFTEELRYAAAALLAFSILGKVLSPQYLIWLIPFIAVLGGPTGRYGRPIFALSCLLTTLTYPVFFGRLLRLELGSIIMLNVRNVLLLTLLALLTFGTVSHTSEPEAEGERFT